MNDEDKKTTVSCPRCGSVHYCIEGSTFECWTVCRSCDWNMGETLLNPATPIIAKEGD